MAKLTLKAARVNAGLKQKQAAEVLGIGNKTLSRWENGASAPTADMIPLICNLYNLHYDDIIFLPQKTPKALFSE